MSLIYSYESSQINGAVFEVHKRMGVGLAEKVYQEAFALELKLRNIPFEREKLYRLHYKGTLLEAYYIADFVCYDKIIVELKAVENLLPVHEAQLLSYLRLTRLPIGLLINFNVTAIKQGIRRLANFECFPQKNI